MFASSGLPQDNHLIWQFAFVGLLGALTGFSELISRYRDNPRRLMGLFATWTYMAGNALVALAAMEMAVNLHWDFGQSAPGGVQAVRIAACGFGSMLLLRSALVSVRIDGRDVSIGPAGVIGALLAAVDRIIDRNQARFRSKDAKRAMQGISFEKSRNILPQFTIKLMESATPDDIRVVLEEVDELHRTTLTDQGQTPTDQAKSYTLGVILIRMAGQEVLADAVGTLKDEICRDSDNEQGVTATPGAQQDGLTGLRSFLLDSELTDSDLDSVERP